MVECFKFYKNMKDIIELYEGNEHLQLLIYDAITEYGLYGVFPENNFPEYAIVAGVIQSLVPTLEKSSNYSQIQAERGSKGGRARKITTEQIEEAIEVAAIKGGKVPTRAEVVDEIQELLGIKIDPKTISRNVPDSRKREIAVSALGQNGDKTDVPQGQNEDKINVPNVPNFGDKTNVPEGHKDKIGTESNVPDVSKGQNGDIKNVPGDKIDVPFVFNF